MALSKSRKKLILSEAGAGRRPVVPQHPDLLAAAYAKRLQAEVERGFRLVEKRLFPLLPKLPSLQRADIANDADRINEVLNGILKSFFGGMLSKEQPNLGRYGRAVASKLVGPMQAQVDNFSQGQFSKQFKRISGVDPLRFAPELNDALEVAGEQNVNKITTIGSEYFDDVRELTYQALRQGTSVKELADEIRILTDSTKTKAKLIAIDQVQKLNADLERTRQQANGIKRYIWRTRRNARVRSKANSSGYSDHAGLEGAVFDYDFPPVTVLKGKRADERNNPGQDINCKCWGEPVIEDLTGKVMPQLLAAERKTQELINAGRVPGYKLPKREKEAA